MSVIDTVKEAANLAKEHGRMDLYEELLKHREDSLKLREESLALKNEISVLKKQEEIQVGLVYHEGVHWIKKDSMTQENSPTPICPRCWDVDKVIVRQKLGRYGSSGFCFSCKNCGKFFKEIYSIPNV